MPSLYSLRPDFNLLSFPDKQAFIRAYRTRRQLDMAKPATYGTAASKTKSENIKFQNLGITKEEIAIAKALGLSIKDIKMLKAATE